LKDKPSLKGEGQAFAALDLPAGSRSTLLQQQGRRGGTAMNKFPIHSTLEEAALWLCQRAIAERRWDLAEPLMRALEQLATSDPSCEVLVEQAYICMSHCESINA
jgi:hypothetical protein